MTTPLDVLVIESRPGAAAAAARALQAAGHTTTSCHPDGAEAAFPCRAVIDPAGCPLDDRPDVALLVRDGNAEPGAHEQGASCAVRDGIPLVEAGPPDALDPYEPWLAGRVDGDTGDIVAACEAARTAALAALRRRILTLVRPSLAAAHISMAGVTCRIEPRGLGLRVSFDIFGPVPAGLRQALAVRTLDAVRGGRRPYEHVSVSVTEVG
jgi:hypothetical protein